MFKCSLRIVWYVCIWHICVVQRLLKYLKTFGWQPCSRMYSKKKETFQLWIWAVLNASENYFLQRSGVHTAQLTLSNSHSLWIYSDFFLEFFLIFWISFWLFFWILSAMDFWISSGFVFTSSWNLLDYFLKMSWKGSAQLTVSSSVIHLFRGWLYFLHF